MKTIKNHLKNRALWTLAILPFISFAELEHGIVCTFQDVLELKSPLSLDKINQGLGQRLAAYNQVHLDLNKLVKSLKEENKLTGYYSLTYLDEEKNLQEKTCLELSSNTEEEVDEILIELNEAAHPRNVTRIGCYASSPAECTVQH